MTPNGLWGEPGLPSETSPFEKIKMKCALFLREIMDHKSRNDRYLGFDKGVDPIDQIRLTRGRIRDTEFNRDPNDFHGIMFIFQYDRNIAIERYGLSWE